MTKRQSQLPDDQMRSSMSCIKQWIYLTVRRFPPAKYLLYSSLFAGAVHMSNPETKLSTSLKWNLLATAGTFLLLWFMRIVDELKDMEHDRKFHADRPLASGRVTVSNALILLVIVGSGTIVFSFSQSWTALSWSVGIMAYSMLLWGAERISNRFESSMLVNLFFAIQLKTMLVFYAGSILTHSPTSILAPTPFALLAISIVCCYLHWEILRKTHPAKTEKKSYSNEVGSTLSIMLGTTLLLSANAVIFVLFNTWLVATLLLFAALPSLVGVLLFSMRRLDTKRLSILTLTGYLFFLAVLAWLRRAEALFNA